MTHPKHGGEHHPHRHADQRARSLHGDKGAAHRDVAAAAATLDPVCGMSVDPQTALSHRHGEKTYYFCSPRCRDKFVAEPERYREAAEPAGAEPEPPGTTLWTCPMHPEIRRDGPGACPICGMALEPLEPTAEEGANHE
jgi:P-type Cu+ transporter